MTVRSWVEGAKMDRWWGVPKRSGTLQFFETVEKLFVMYEVPGDVKVKLLIPLLTAQAKALKNRLTVD